MAYGTIKVDTITFTDAGVDKSVTISGLVQNPTFSGNITVTGTVSGNTIRGQTVSGATITGGAAAFTTVTGGVATITSGVFALGSASNPSISFSGDANSGLYSPGADQVAISTNGTGRLFVDSSGRLGLGTTSPASPLTVVTGNGAANGISLAGGSNVNDSQNLRFGFYFGGNYEPVSAMTGVLTGGGPTQGALTFSTVTSGSLTEKARIDSSGRLLVGTSTARSILGLTPSFQVESTGGYVGPVFSSNANDSSGSYIFFAKSRGAALNSNTIVSSGDQLGTIAFCGADGSAQVEGARIAAVVDGTPGANDLPTRLVFSVTQDGSASPTERIRLENAGRSLFFSSGNGIAVGVAAGAGTTTELFAGIYSRTSTTAGGSASIIIYSNGNVLNTNNSYGSLSDVKLKENIVDANSQWDDLKALQVRKYNFKEGQTHTQIGLVAQEVELVSPGLVSESPDRDAEGNDLGTTTKSVNYSVLYMKAVKALQEAMERIETLEAKVAALESA
jgi:hypothetical protein